MNPDRVLHAVREQLAPFGFDVELEVNPDRRLADFRFTLVVRAACEAEGDVFNYRRVVDEREMYQFAAPALFIDHMARTALLETLGAVRRRLAAKPAPIRNPLLLETARG